MKMLQELEEHPRAYAIWYHDLEAAQITLSRGIYQLEGALLLDGAVLAAKVLLPK